MEENEQKIDEHSEAESTEWRGHPGVTTHDEVVASPAKDPNSTPTDELVRDYESTLKHINAMNDRVLEIQAAMKAASVEGAKMLTLISKRLGMPLNGAQPVRTITAEEMFGKHATRLGQPSPTPCKYCGKPFRNGLGMHEQAHERAGDKFRRGIGIETKVVIPSRSQTRWCDPCGVAIQTKGWAAHQAAHARHGDTLPRKVSQGHQRRKGMQSMGPEKIDQLLKAMHRAGPISSKDLGDRYFGGKNISAFMSGLKQRGLATNDPATHLWRVVEG